MSSSFILKQLIQNQPISPDYVLTPDDITDLGQTPILSSYLSQALLSENKALLDELIKQGLKGEMMAQNKTFDSDFMHALIEKGYSKQFQYIFAHLGNKQCGLRNDTFIKMVAQDDVESLALVWPYQTQQCHENALNVSSYRRKSTRVFHYCYEHMKENADPIKVFRGSITHAHLLALDYAFPLVEEKNHFAQLVTSSRINNPNFTHYFIEKMDFDVEKQIRTLQTIASYSTESDLKLLNSYLEQAILRKLTPQPDKHHKRLRL